jgi:hypothetical protein
MNQPQRQCARSEGGFMTHILRSARGQCFAALVFAALVASACSGTETSSQSIIAKADLRPASWTYTPLDYPNQTHTHINGININDEVVGDYGPVTNTIMATNYRSFTATPPYGSSSFDEINFPRLRPKDDVNMGTVMTALNPNPTGATSLVVVGYAYNPDPQTLPGLWGLVVDQGLINLMQPAVNESPCPAEMELLGVDDKNNAVGYYVPEIGETCEPPQAFVDAVGEEYDNVKPSPPGSSNMATGINDKGDIVGNELAPKLEGWIAPSAAPTAYPFRYNHTTHDTQALGINSSDWIVGSYVDAVGTHGYVVSGLAGSKETWYQIDRGNDNFTVVTGINDKNDICGWYKNSDRTTHGFVGKYSPSLRPQRHAHKGSPPLANP